MRALHAKLGRLIEHGFTPSSTCTLEGWGAAIAAVGAVAGGAIGAAGAEGAANTQASAELQAAQLQSQEQQSIQGLEAPYVGEGDTALQALNYGLGLGPNTPTAAAGGASGVSYGALSQPFDASYMQQYSPAYQFQLQQGQSGLLNSMSGGQGALSGSALTNLAQFNQNYANTAYNNAFNQYQTQQNNTYSRLSGLAQLGQAGASQQASAGVQLAGNAGSAIAGAGAAQAAGTVGAANAISGGLSSLSQYALMSSLGGNSSNPYGSTSSQDVLEDVQSPGVDMPV